MKSPRQDAVWVSSRWPRGARVFYLIFFWTIAHFFSRRAGTHEAAGFTAHQAGPPVRHPASLLRSREGAQRDRRCADRKFNLKGQQEKTSKNLAKSLGTILIDLKKNCKIS